MKTTAFLFYLLLVVGALNTTHNAVYNQCLLFVHQDLPGSDFQLKLTVTLYFCAIFFVRCLIGLVADRCSGRKCIVITLWVAFLGHVLAGSSTHLSMFVVARFIQGLGLGGGQVLGLVLLMQLFSHKGRASIIAAEQVIFSVAAVSLPLLGHYFSSHGHWRWMYGIYSVLTMVAIAYFSLFQSRESSIEVPSETSATTSHSLMTNRAFLLPTLMAAFTASAYCLWVSYFSLLVQHYHIDFSYLMLYQLLPLLPYFIGSIGFKKWTASVSKAVWMRRILAIQAATFLSILLLFGWNKTGKTFPWVLLVPILLHNIASAFFRPWMQEKALEAVPVHKIGSASSFLSICQVGVNAIFSIFINCMGSFLPAFVGVQLLINLSILAYLCGQLRPNGAKKVSSSQVV